MAHRAYWHNGIFLVAPVSLSPIPNRAPVAVADAYAVAADENYISVDGTLGVLANDTDADGNILTAELVSDVSTGTLTLNANGSFSYTRGSDAEHADTFIYKAWDGQYYSNPVTVTLTVAAIPAPVLPVGVADAWGSFTTGVAKTIAAPGVLANDTGTPPLTAELYADVSHGTLSLLSTGAFTYTPTSPYTGTDTFQYRVKSGALYSSPVTVTLTAVAAVTGIEINQTLVDAASSPYELSQTSGTYQLSEDITVDGSGFVVTADNVTLDLNGYTLTYNNRAPVVVTNGGFETGNTTGWDVTNAAHGAVATNDVYMWGTKLFKFDNFGQNTEWIISDAIALTVTGQQYVATITPKAVYYETSITLAVLNASTGAVIASTTSTDNERAFSIEVPFTLTSPISVKLKITVAPCADITKTNTVRIDNATIAISEDYAVINCGYDTTKLPARWQAADWLYAAQRANNFTVTNGYIVQGAGVGFECHAFWANDSTALTIDTVDVTLVGDNTDGVISIEPKSCTVKDSTWTCTINNITNRMHKGHVLYLPNSVGDLLIDGNTINTAPHQGICVGGNRSGTITISNNDILDSAEIVTNGYGIVVGNASNVTINDNTITTTDSGRGILIEQEGDTIDVDTIDVYNNTVSVWEQVNREYRVQDLSATGLRIRAFDRLIKNLHVYNNTFTATTDATRVRSAKALAVTLNNNSSSTDCNILIENNTFKAICDTTSTDFWAIAANFLTVADSTQIVLQNNILESNDISLAFCGDDGADCRGVKCLSNTSRKSTDGAARTHTAVRAGYYIYTAENLEIYGHGYDQGASRPINFLYGTTGARELSYGWLLTVLVKTAAGVVIPSAAVTVKNQTGATVATGTTDSNGLVSDLEIVTEYITGTGSVQPTPVSYNPHAITVTKAGYQNGGASVTLTSSTTVTVTLFVV